MKKNLKVILILFLTVLIILCSFVFLCIKNIHNVSFKVSPFCYCQTTGGDNGPSVILRDLSTFSPSVSELPENTKSNIWGYVDEPSSPRVGSLLSKLNFSGWYIDPECTIPFDFSKDKIQSDIVLYAKIIRLP